MRNYGFGDYTRYIVGTPHLKKLHTEPLGDNLALPQCINCGIMALCEIEVLLENLPTIRSKWALGSYLSCPACPWASPMIAHAVDSLPDWMFR